MSSRLFVRNSKIANIQEHPGRLKIFISRKNHSRFNTRMSREPHLNIYLIHFLKDDHSHVPGLLYRNWPLGRSGTVIGQRGKAAASAVVKVCWETARQENSTPCLLPKPFTFHPVHPASITSNCYLLHYCTVFVRIPYIIILCQSACRLNSARLTKT